MASIPRRKNGLTPPFSAMQISTWITLPTLLVEFTLFCSPVLRTEASIPVTIVFWGLGLMCAYWGYKASSTDPMDLRLACALAEQQDNDGDEPEGCLCFRSYSAGVQEPPQGESTKYCWVCETDVAEHSMHCKYCNKCVSHFDHHCQWLNTCVGEANYPYFNHTLWSITLFLFAHLTVMVVIVVDIFVEFAETRQFADDWFGAGLPGLVAGVNIFFIIFDSIAFALIAQLLYFHLGLQREGITTYQYILRDNQQKREKQKELQVNKARRAVAITKAKREGKSTLGLKIGEHVPCCDPLQTEEQEEGPTRRGRSSEDGKEEDLIQYS